MKRDEVITIGMTASINGRYSLQGQQVLAGAKAWVRDTNLQGGIFVGEDSRQLPIRLVYHDDESSPNLCQDLTEKLIVDDKVDILLGPYSSGLTLRAASVAETHNRVLWNHSGALGSSSRETRAWMVNILTPARRYFHGFIDFSISKSPNLKHVGIVYSTAGAFPKAVAKGAVSHCGSLSLNSIKEYPYKVGTRDFTPILEQLEKDSPDLILGVGRIEDDIAFAKQYVSRDYRAKAIALIAGGIELFGEEMAEASEGFLAPSQWEPGVISDPNYGPTESQVLESLSSESDLPIDYPMIQSYAAGLIAQKCITEDGTLDNESLREVARRLDFSTFDGRFRLDPDSGAQIGHPMPVVQWQAGKKIVVWPENNQV